jgi:hypothetical protein
VLLRPAGPRSSRTSLPEPRSRHSAELDTGLLANLDHGNGPIVEHATYYNGMRLLSVFNCAAAGVSARLLEHH